MFVQQGFWGFGEQYVTERVYLQTVTIAATKNGSTPISDNLGMAVAASFVWSVDNTK